jgi:hypothetical protein
MYLGDFLNFDKIADLQDYISSKSGQVPIKGCSQCSEGYIKSVD